jgi:hypothetical protein
MNRFFELFVNGIRVKSEANDSIVEMNEWFHNLTFDVLPCAPSVI